MKSAEKSNSTTPTITTTMAQMLLSDLSLTSAAETEADVCQLSQGTPDTHTVVPSWSSNPPYGKICCSK